MENARMGVIFAGSLIPIYAHHIELQDIDGVSVMMEANRFYRESEHYRAWVDTPGTGSIRVLKRVNFKALVRLFREMLTEMKKEPAGHTHIIFYISRSLNDEMSDNALEFLDFCKACLGIQIELVILE